MMVERVGFARGLHMDEFYLPEEMIEWLGCKKSILLSELISHAEGDDFNFEQYQSFERLIPQTLAAPELIFDSEEDKIYLKTFVKTYSDPEIFQQIVIGAMIPDQNKDLIFVTILSFVTRKQNLIKIFCRGKPTLKPVVN
jgi:hypothetical protein